jgi:acetyl esterase/lipase
VLRDQRYGSGPKESLDLFLPRGPARGTFVFVHGGYWRSLDKAEHAFVAPPLTAQGIAVAVVNYDLCPRVSIATIVDQAARAVAWVIGEGARHGASAHRLVVGGHSAGGHVAAMLMARDWRDDGFPMNPLHGGVSLSGVHDLRPLTRFSYNVDLKLDDDEAAKLSPVLLGATTHARWSWRSARTRRASSCASPTSCGTPGRPTVLPGWPGRWSFRQAPLRRRPRPRRSRLPSHPVDARPVSLVIRPAALDN